MSVADAARDETVAVDGLPVRVRRTGDGRPLLLINGLGAPLEMWGPLTACVPGHELVAFDLPGTGESPPAPRLRRMPEIAAFVGRLLDALGYERVDALGYSWGSLLAQQVARTAPERIERLVLCASSPGVISLPPHPLAATLMLTPARYYNRALARMIVPVIAGGRTRHDSGALDAQLRQRLASRPSTIGYLHQLYAMTGWTSAPWLRGLQQPTLILHGDDDPLIPLLNARFIARAMPNAQLHVVRGGGHLFLLDEPERVAGTMRAFLSRAPG